MYKPSAKPKINEPYTDMRFLNGFSRFLSLLKTYSFFSFYFNVDSFSNL